MNAAQAVSISHPLPSKGFNRKSLALLFFILATSSVYTVSPYKPIPTPTPTPIPTPTPTTVFRDDFDGNSLDSSKWTAGNWSGDPIILSVVNGFATINNYYSYIGSNQMWFQNTVEGQITLTEGSHFGLANTLNGIDAHWMIFSVSNGTVLARTRLDDGQSEVNTPLAGIQLGAPHDWKIIWKADNSIEFWVDDVLKATHTRVFAEQLRVYVSAGQTVNGDWVQVSSTSPTPTPSPTPSPSPSPTPTATPTPTPAPTPTPT